jgi:hypothetical protein
MASALLGPPELLLEVIAVDVLVPSGRLVEGALVPLLELPEPLSAPEELVPGSTHALAPPSEAAFESSLDTHCTPCQLHESASLSESTFDSSLATLSSTIGSSPQDPCICASC